MEKSKGFFQALAALVFIGWTGIGIAGESKVPPEVWEKAQTKGVVRVLVQLDVPWQPEGKLSKDAVLAQRKAIAAAQDNLLVELAGTKHEVTRRFDFIRGLALEVGLDALEVLERSARVMRVTEDRPLQLQQHSVPKESR